MRDIIDDKLANALALIDRFENDVRASTAVSANIHL